MAVARSFGTGPGLVQYDMEEFVTDLRDEARNRLLKLAGHFAHPVRVDAVEEIGPAVYLVKVRHASGQPDETQLTAEELELALAQQ